MTPMMKISELCHAHNLRYEAGSELIAGNLYKKVVRISNFRYPSGRRFARVFDVNLNSVDAIQEIIDWMNS